MDRFRLLQRQQFQRQSNDATTSGSANIADCVAHAYLSLDRYKKHRYTGNHNDKRLGFYTLIGCTDAFSFLGFGFAYVFRFLWNALPFKKQYQRGIATTVIVLVCGGVLFYTGKQVSRQASQMGVGLLKFYHETVLPHAIGETFTAVAISVNSRADEDDGAESNEENPPAETFYLGTNHGIYEMRPNTEGKPSPIGITNGGLLGKPIRVLTASENVIYAGTQSGLYRYYKTPPVDDGNDASSTQIWHKVEDTPFDTLAIQAINVPHWDDAQVYVGTQKGLYASDNAGETWNPVAPNIYGDKSIVSIISAADNGHRVTYVASRQMDVETPLEQEESQTTAAEMDVAPSEQLEQTDTTSTARKTERKPLHNR